MKKEFGAKPANRKLIRHGVSALCLFFVNCAFFSFYYFIFCIILFCFIYSCIAQTNTTCVYSQNFQAQSSYKNKTETRLNAANDMVEPALPLAINTLSNLHAVEVLLQLTVGSDAVVIANS